MDFKELTVADLAKDYSDRKGFIFQANQSSSDRAIEHLSNILIQHNITPDMPEFIVRLDDKTTAFVYKDTFNSPAFFQRASIATMMGVCIVEDLNEFLTRTQNATAN